MKRTIRLITLFALVLTISISLFGCTFIKKETSSSEQTNSNYTVLSDGTQLVDSLQSSSDFTFSSADREDETKHYSSVQETIKNTNINRSVVAIDVLLDSTSSTANYSRASGVIVDIDDGIEGNDNVFYVVTCHHVLENCANYPNNIFYVSITDDSGKTLDDSGYNQTFRLSSNISTTINASASVQLVGSDKNSDIGLLKIIVPDAIKNKIVKAKIISTNYFVELGEVVFAVGDSKGTHRGRVSTGTIADICYETNWDGIGNMVLLDIDVNTYPGNSGGGLFNLYGELVGITNGGEVLYIGSETVVTGINFAIPHITSNDSSTDNGFVNIIAQLLSTYKLANGKNYGYVSGHHPLFGITVSLGVDTNQNEYVYLVSVTANSLASAAGLKANDIIVGVTVNGKEKTSPTYSEFTSIMSSLKIGDKIIFSVERTETEYGRDKWGKLTQTTVVKTYSYEMSVCQTYFMDTGVYEGIEIVQD